ncbi:MAG: glycosyltransferase family 1 protein [Bacteroidales bacterium]|nr:glycosyltransferase family 1 protein [Bacteroidales bacterium]
MIFRFRSIHKGHVYTRRELITHRCWQLVWEWEDDFSKLLKWPLYIIKHGSRRYNHVPVRVVNFSLPLAEFMCPWEWELVFEMIPDLEKPLINAKRIIPCIIDYYLTDDQVPIFLEKYRKCPIVLLSSLEAYQHVIDSKYPERMGVRIGHLPLSISDKYKLTYGGERKYDVAILGRTNPVLFEFLSQYLKKHPISYILRKDDEEGNVCFDSFGNYFGFIDNRDNYLNMMKQTKVALYSTPGIDGGESRCNGFSQVTPRFLEHIACGNHIIARYKKNEDTDFYELERFSPSIETYAQFEERMDYCLSHDIDKNLYSDYLVRHYTSASVEQFKKILNEIVDAR